MKDLKDRYQNQKWYVKLWRRRWYIAAYFWFLKMMIFSKSFQERRSKILWAIALSDAQMKMNWWYTLEEVNELLERKVLNVQVNRER